MAEQVIIEFIADTSKFEEAYNKISSQVSDTSNLKKDSVTAFQKANADAAKSFSEAIDGARQLNDQLRNIKSVIAGGIVKNLVNDLNAVNDIQKKSSGNTKTLSGQLIEAKTRFVELADAGKKGTQEYINQQIEVQRLVDVMNYLQKTVTKLNEETKELSSLSALANEAASGFENAANAAQKSATKNEESESTISRLDTAVKIFITSMETGKSVQEALTAARLLDVSATEAQKAAEAGWIGIAIAGIAEVAYYMYNLITADKEYKEQLRGTKLAIEEQNIELGYQKRVYEDLGESVVKFDKQILQNNETLLDKEHEAALRKRATNISTLLKELTAGPDEENDDLRSDEEKKEDDGYLLKKKEFVVKYKDLDRQAKKELADQQDKHELLMLGKNYSGFQKELELFRRSREKQKAEYKNADDKLEFQAQTDALVHEKIRENDLKNERKTIEAKLELVKEGTNSERTLRKALAANEAKGVFENRNSSPEDIAKAKATYTAAVTLANKKYYDIINSQIGKANQDQLELDIQGLEDKRSAEIKGGKEDIAILDEINDKKLQIAAIGNQKLMDDRSDEYKAFVRQQEIEKQEYLANVAQATTQENQQALQQLRSNNAAQLQIQKEFRLSQEQVDKMFEEERKNHPDENDEQVYAAVAVKLKPEEDAAKAKIKLQEDTEKQIATASIQFAKQASDEIFAVVNQNRNQRYNAEISALEKQKDFELNNNNLTQAQKLAIQRKFDKETAAIKLQQWKADQKSKEEQAIINGALAVTNILATTPAFDFGIAQYIAIAAAAASTATSVATIAAQKPPQFATGTPAGTPDTPAGMKLVGEHGPELIYTPGGERIITAPDTAAILAKYEVPALPNVSADVMMRANAQYITPVINEKSLAKEIAGEIAKQSKPLLQFDKNGFTAHLVGKGGKTTILNNKYRL